MSKARPAPEPRRSNRPRAVGDMLPDVGGASFRRFGFVQHAVVSRWGEIVGERYARVSTPESIRFPAGKKAEGTLAVAVEGAHAAMFQHVAPVIVERVNRFFGYEAVARVAIRQGAAIRRAPPSLRPIPPQPSEALGASLRDVADPELRACLAALGAAVEAAEARPVPAMPIPVLGKVR